jgi:hypothetical protein
MEEAVARLGGERVRGTSEQGQHRRRGRALQEDRQAQDGVRFFSLTARGEWSSELRRQMIDPDLGLLISRQSELLGIPRSTYDYERGGSESEENLELMRLIDEIYPTHPEKGQRMMVRALKLCGIFVNRKRVRRLMGLIGIRSLSLQPKTIVPNMAHPVYPYLLRGLVIDHPNHVWGGRHHLCPLQKGILVLGRDHGLAFEEGALLAVVEHHDGRLLRRGLARSPRPLWTTRDLQHG